jgi:hypothetical protein
MILEKLQAGELIDMEMFRRGGKEGAGVDEQMSLYRRFLLNKYP